MINNPQAFASRGRYSADYTLVDPSVEPDATYGTKIFLNARKKKNVYYSIPVLNYPISMPEVYEDEGLEILPEFWQNDMIIVSRPYLDAVLQLVRKFVPAFGANNPYLAMQLSYGPYGTANWIDYLDRLFVCAGIVYDTNGIKIGTTGLQRAVALEYFTPLYSINFWENFGHKRSMVSTMLMQPQSVSYTI